MSGGGFSFGAPPNASVMPGSTGGLTATTGTNFGFGSGGTTFGIAAQPSFGTTSTTSLPTFGAPTTGTSTGLSFGGLTMTGSAPPAFGATPNTGLSFNTPATSAGTVGFGIATTTSAPTLNLSFGTAPTASTSSGFSFNPPASTATSTFGLGGFSATPQTSLSTGFGTLGGTSTTTTGFGLGTSATPTLGGLGGAAKPTLTLGTSTAPATSTFVGLGGIDTNLSNLTGGSSGNQGGLGAEKAAKDNNLLDVTLNEFREFAEFIRQQKNLTSELSRASTKPMHKVKDDVTSLSHQLDTIQKQIHTLTSAVKSLRGDAAMSLQHAEMAQQTYDTPSGFQLEYFAPDEYFANMTSNIERQLFMFRGEVDNMEKLLSQVSDSSALKSDAVLMGVRQLHNIFIALASKLQGLHSHVNREKDSCLSLRRHILHDTTDIFEILNTTGTQSKHRVHTQRNISGPPLFSSLGGNLPPPNQLSQTSLGARTSFPAPLSYGLGQSSGMTANLGTSFSSGGEATENRTFQLQQPPIGNKRNKR